jgi:beta-galactosidase
MVDCNGHKVPSSNRNECHFGLTPGGCTDHPEVWARMAGFLEAVATRYKDLPHLHGWDIWNELRWNVQAGDLVCYCPHTLEDFRAWLRGQFGDLDGLNRAWQRRYASWEDVMPGIATGRPFTESMAFARFIRWRCAEQASKRYEIFQRLDGRHPATVHGDSPAFLKGGGKEASPQDRGNDFDYADRVDGIGCSSFPLWGLTDAPDFAQRIEALPAAANGKKVWLSEVQGGEAAGGTKFLPPVPARPQQRWLWTGFANGADTVLFWCWRDEIFTTEAGGFGFSGNDGLYPERASAMRRTAEVLDRHGDEIGAFQPDPASIGVFFSPESYALYWSMEGRGGRAQMALQGWGRALLKQRLPFRLVEERHLDALNELKLLILPRTVVIDDDTAERLEAFVRAGGALLCEPETGAYDSRGIFRYPEERFTARLTGCVEVGRRELPGQAVTVELGGASYELPATQWLGPIGQAAGEKSGDLLVTTPVGKGQVIQLAAYAADPYLESDLCGTPTWQAFTANFERFVAALAARTGVAPTIETEDESFVYTKAGTLQGRRAAYIMQTTDEAGPARVRFGDWASSNTVSDLITDASIDADGDGWLTVSPDPELGVALLVEQRGGSPS